MNYQFRFLTGERRYTRLPRKISGANMIQQIQQRPSPYEIAKELLETRFKGAEVVFAAGSIRRNEATASSDIDLVVVYPKLEQAYRESFTFKGWPVEAFVHDPETLNYFFWEVDAKGRNSLSPIHGRRRPSHPRISPISE
jgi:predicted nucleotidyltransferase